MERVILKNGFIRGVHIGIKKVGKFFDCRLLMFIYVLLCRQKYQKRPLNFGYGLRHRLRFPQRRKPWRLVGTIQSISSALHLVAVTKVLSIVRCRGYADIFSQTTNSRCRITNLNSHQFMEGEATHGKRESQRREILP